MKLIPLPAFQDDSLWMMHDGRRARVADAGDAHPVLACLQHDRLQLEAILVTHHRPDHLGTAGALRHAAGAGGDGTAKPPGSAGPIHYIRHNAVARAAPAPAGATPPDRMAVFAALRPWKNEFK